MTDTDPKVLVDRWFSSVHEVSPEMMGRLRDQVLHKLETGACRHLLPKMPEEYLRGVELQTCVEQVISDLWDDLTPDERLLTRFPNSKAIGEQVDIPNRGAGIIIRRELTRRFGVEVTFKMQDGSLFKWEFWD